MCRSPSASVVIPTHNRAELLRDCLDSLVALDPPGEGFEIVVADAACTDSTASLTAKVAARQAEPAVKHLRVGTSDANAARNAGLAAATGQLLVLIDDDVLVPPRWLEALVAGAASWPEAECFGGPVRPRFESTPPRTCRDHEPAGARFEPPGPSREVDELWGGNLAIRRAALARVGPFREGLPMLQEWEWEQRLLAAGGKLVFLPEAWLWHRRSAADLRLLAMVREFFLRGYLHARLDTPLASRPALRRAGGNLLHAVRGRCTRGLTETARELGMAWGASVERAYGKKQR